MDTGKQKAKVPINLNQSQAHTNTPKPNTTKASKIGISDRHCVNISDYDQFNNSRDNSRGRDSTVRNSIISPSSINRYENVLNKPISNRRSTSTKNKKTNIYNKNAYEE